MSIAIVYLRATCGSNTNGSCNLTTNQRIGVYGGLTASLILTGVGRTTLFFVLVLRSSRLLHNKMFASVLRAPVLFFDTNPSGEWSVHEEREILVPTQVEY